jgi:polar amino acid transport system permease protein
MWNEASELLPLLLRGAQTTVEVTIVAAFVAFAVSVTAGLCRLSNYRSLRGATVVYVEVFRGTSLLVQMIWMYYALPLMGIELPKFAAAVIAIGLNYGAYGSEIVRSSILSVSQGQREAAIALNLTPIQTMTRIIFPQAFIRMLPPFGNLLIEMVKATSLVYFITITDLTFQAMVLRNNYFDLSAYIFFFLLCIYFLINYAISLGIRFLERKLAVGRT